MYSAQEIVAANANLKTLPAIYTRIRDELESEDGSLPEVTRLVAHDAALSGRILQVVNSPLYGFAGQIDNVMRAVQLLGMQQLHDLVLAMSVSEMFEDVDTRQMNMRMFWRLGVLRGLASRVTARRCGLLDAERMFVLGLLASLGHLVLYLTVPQDVAHAQRIADETGESLDSVERRLIGASDAEVCCALFESWRLPRNFSPIAGGQYHPVLAGEHSYEAAILCLANHIVDADRLGLASQDAAQRVPSGIWPQLDLEAEQLSEIREEAELNLAAVTAMFFPRVNA
ncbi:HDOD domain-containing protein [Nitrogeniibacter mangrovi]|uniref:HDOD domain-containing protein n=1 Tax=Nitrogeniibacter mangrovi TaxID=2016596 RepID=A0A6C1B3Z6_9RHOO|nr:HDOD domain-containing protein [Nitrogeniibacter mangrovi]QID17719.1 HDOD domain-containing protein [Nitrogeniibacter mangrovi]